MQFNVLDKLEKPTEVTDYRFIFKTNLTLIHP